jgi:hypothetical protein
MEVFVNCTWGVRVVNGLGEGLGNIWIDELGFWGRLMKSVSSWRAGLWMGVKSLVDLGSISSCLSELQELFLLKDS